MVNPDKAQEYLMKNVRLMEARNEKDKELAAQREKEEGVKISENSYF